MTRKENLVRLHAAVLVKDVSAILSLVCGDEHTEGEGLSLLWEPIRSRRSAMHVASRSFLGEQYQPGSSSGSTCSFWASSSIERKAICSDLWRWILQQASPSKGRLLTDRDKSGETCLDIFLSSWLAPPIGSPRKFRSFEKSLNQVISEPESLNLLRSWITEQLHHNKETLPVPCRPHIDIVARFWRALEVICRAAELGDVDDFSMQCAVLPLLARLGSCPEPIARLVVSLFPEQARIRTAAALPSVSADQRLLRHSKSASASSPAISGAYIGSLPLHLWAQSPNPSDPDRDSLLAVLIQAHPDGLACVDGNQRLPLHIALESGKFLHNLHRLWESHPHVLHAPDPVTQLPVFCLTALALKREQRTVARATEKRGPSVSLYEWLTEHNTHRAERDVCQHDPRAAARLSVLYRVVRAHPAALMRSNFANFDVKIKKSSPLFG